MRLPLRLMTAREAADLRYDVAVRRATDRFLAGTWSMEKAAAKIAGAWRRYLRDYERAGP